MSKTQKQITLTVLIILIPLCVLMILFYKQQTNVLAHQQSQIIQSKCLTVLLNQSNHNLKKLDAIVPLKQQGDEYILFAEQVKQHACFKDKVLQDFYGYAFQVNQQQQITNATFYKP